MVDTKRKLYSVSERSASQKKVPSRKGRKGSPPRKEEKTQPPDNKFWVRTSDLLKFGVSIVIENQLQGWAAGFFYMFLANLERRGDFSNARDVFDAKKTDICVLLDKNPSSKNLQNLSYSLATLRDLDLLSYNAKGPKTLRYLHPKLVAELSKHRGLQEVPRQASECIKDGHMDGNAEHVISSEGMQDKGCTIPTDDVSSFEKSTEKATDSFNSSSKGSTDNVSSLEGVMSGQATDVVSSSEPKRSISITGVLHSSFKDDEWGNNPIGERMPLARIFERYPKEVNMTVSYNDGLAWLKEFAEAGGGPRMGKAFVTWADKYMRAQRYDNLVNCNDGFWSQIWDRFQKTFLDALNCEPAHEEKSKEAELPLPPMDWFPI